MLRPLDGICTQDSTFATSAHRAVIHTAPTPTMLLTNLRSYGDTGFAFPRTRRTTCAGVVRCRHYSCRIRRRDVRGFAVLRTREPHAAAADGKRNAERPRERVRRDDAKPHATECTGTRYDVNHTNARPSTTAAE